MPATPPPRRMTLFGVTEHVEQLRRWGRRLVYLRDARESLADFVRESGDDPLALVFAAEQANRLSRQMDEIRRAIRRERIAFDSTDLGLER